METERIRLEPLTKARIPELITALGVDPEIYRWLLFPSPENLSDLAQVLDGFIDETRDGLRIAYAVILKANDLAIGTTSFLDLNPAHHSLEIGATFYAKQYWNTFVNSECKLLMLTEAFENRDAERVSLKTDSMNERSRKAILRLGAKFEGILRHHRKRPDGTWRDSAYFSILRSEWPALKEELKAKLSQSGRT